MTEIAVIPTPQEDVLCPLCGYNLRGLPEARCPECGGRFTWDELRDPDKRLHPYLFEHHPERIIRTFIRTLIGTLRPWTFWKNLSPAQPSRPTRIVLYWLMCALVMLAVLVSRFVADVAEFGAYNRTERAWLTSYYLGGNTGLHPGVKPKSPADFFNQLQIRARLFSSGRNGVVSDKDAEQIISQFGSLQRMIDIDAPPPGSGAFYLAAAGIRRGIRYPGQFPRSSSLGWMMLVAFVWPWVTALTFTIFRVTLRRAKLRPAHIIRVAVYNADIVVWLALMVAPAIGSDLVAASTMKPGSRPGNWSQFYLLAALAPPVGVLIYTLRLWIACRKYLQIRHAMATVISVQIIVILSIPASVIAFGMLLHLLSII